MQNQPSPTIFYSENILYLLIQNYFSKIYIGMICSTMYLCIEKFSYSKRSMIYYKGFFLNFLAHAKQSLFSITTQLLLIQYHNILTIILGKIYYFWRQAYLICLKSETGSFLKLFLPTHKILHIRNPSQSAQESFRNFSQHLSQCYFYFQKLCTIHFNFVQNPCYHIFERNIYHQLLQWVRFSGTQSKQYIQTTTLHIGHDRTVRLSLVCVEFSLSIAYQHYYIPANSRNS